jgi:hypothetical protein
MSLNVGSTTLARRGRRLLRGNPQPPTLSAYIGRDETAVRGVAIFPLTWQGDPAGKSRKVQIGEAKKELRTALELAPNDADAQNALTMLERTHEEPVN